MYTLVQCTPLLVEKTGVAPDMTLSFTVQKQVCGQENHPGFETYGEGHMKSKIGGITGPTKWTLVQQKFKKKKNFLNAIIKFHLQPPDGSPGTDLCKNAVEQYIGTCMEKEKLTDLLAEVEQKTVIVSINKLDEKYLQFIGSIR